MTNLLHITYDMRRRTDTPITTAVKDVIIETKKIADVKIIDLLRVNTLSAELIKLQRNNHLMVNSFGFPFGIFLISGLKRTYKKIIDAENQGIIDFRSTDVIHAHKATFEGYIGYLLALKLNSKLILTLRQTDSWVFRRRPDLIKHFKPVFERSDKIIYLVPYIIVLMKKYLGEEFFNHHMRDKLEFIPNIVQRNIEPDLFGSQNGYYSTALRMDRRSVWRKNIKRLFKAVQILNDPAFKLIVLGDGDYFPKLKRLTVSLGIENNIIFKGNIPNAEMDKFYSSSTAFLMPSLSESFGMVYAESLLNGTPIMYSKDCMGFDGIFENVGVKVDPFSVDSIADGIRDLIKNHSIYKQNIMDMQQKGEFRIFSAAHVRNRYSQIINSLLNQPGRKG